MHDLEKILSAIEDLKKRQQHFNDTESLMNDNKKPLKIQCSWFYGLYGIGQNWKH